MAQITLIRHGKAETSDFRKQDFQRSLSIRGQQNSLAVGAFLAKHKMLPQLVLVSPATRTRQTYEFMARYWPDNIAVKFIDELYEATANNLFKLIIDHGGDWEKIAVIGHNPSLVVLLNLMVGQSNSDKNLSYFPTCCFADIVFEAKKICDVDADAGRRVDGARERRNRRGVGRNVGLGRRHGTPDVSGAHRERPCHRGRQGRAVPSYCSHRRRACRPRPG